MIQIMVYLICTRKQLYEEVDDIDHDLSDMCEEVDDLDHDLSDMCEEVGDVDHDLSDLSVRDAIIHNRDFLVMVRAARALSFCLYCSS